MNRRDALRTLAGSASAMALGSGMTLLGQSASQGSRLGMVTYAMGIHQRNQWAGRHAGLPPALALLEESHSLGAGGIQVELSADDVPHLDDLRQRAQRYGMHLEAIISPPQNEADVARFEQGVSRAKQAGAKIARTVIIPGRRYERFASLDEFREFENRGERALERAEPILRRNQFRLAVENHKDQRTGEKLAMLKRISSEYIGLCVDVGNNFPLVEDPLDTVRAFAPWALTVHLKDQAVREDDEGFWLADVALGEGFLDLPSMVSVLRRANPDITFNFETITRDPIKVPMLTDGFWATLGDTPAWELARTLRLLKNQSHPEAFALVSALRPDQQLALERRNIEKSLVYAREELGL